MITGLLSTDREELRAKDQVGQKLLSTQVGFKILEWEAVLVRKGLRISQKALGCIHLTATGLLLYRSSSEHESRSPLLDRKKITKNEILSTCG